MTSPRPWQCVLIAWGDRYPVAEINLLADSIRRQSASLARMVLITDRDRPGIYPGILAVSFPPFFLDPRFLTGGCQAKLAMFAQDVVPGDLPAVYVDLDTVVLGDLARLLPLTGPDHHRIAMLQSAVLPFGALGRLAHRLTSGRRYARGNSSVVVWHPRHGTAIAARFQDMARRHPDLAPRPMAADERFISWAAQDRMRAIPRSLAVKFPTEFMYPRLWIGRLLAALPWVRARRAGLVAVTLPGEAVKGETLLALPEGALITDRKGRRVEWSPRTLGPLKDRLLAHYRRLT
ncbi:MAG: hypothetical protein ACK4GO_08330 [Gemmobacter sp.]